MELSVFLQTLESITQLKTLYVLGAWGQPLNEINKKKLIFAQEYNKKPARQAMIEAASDDTFAFDCSGLIKSVLWGFSGDPGKRSGGASYGTGSVPDLNAAGLIKACQNVRALSDPEPGELLYMAGHCGIYNGNGEVIECSPKWKNGAQVTNLTDRKWLKVGRLPWVEYEAQSYIYFVPPATLRRGSRGMRVDQLQWCLNVFAYNLKVDGIYGPKTEEAVRVFQHDNGLSTDGIYGPKTRTALAEALKRKGGAQ